MTGQGLAAIIWPVPPMHEDDGLDTEVRYVK